MLLQLQLAALLIKQVSRARQRTREREGESCRGRNGNTLLILTYGIFIMRHTQWCPTSRECHEAFVSRVAFREFFMLTREAEAGHKDIIIIINKA